MRSLFLSVTAALLLSVGPARAQSTPLASLRVVETCPLLADGADNVVGSLPRGARVRAYAVRSGYVFVEYMRREGRVDADCLEIGADAFSRLEDPQPSSAKAPPSDTSGAYEALFDGLRSRGVVFVPVSVVQRATLRDTEGVPDARVPLVLPGDTLRAYMADEEQVFIVWGEPPSRVPRRLRRGDAAVRPRDVALLESQRPIVQAYLARHLALLDSLQQAEEARIYAAMPDLLITEIRAVGDDYSTGARIQFYNLRAGKAIKYVRFTLRPYNRVGDVVGSRYGGGEETVTGIGPFNPSLDVGAEWENGDLWPTALIDCVRIVGASVEYMDGSRRAWRSNLGEVLGDEVSNSCAP